MSFIHIYQLSLEFEFGRLCLSLHLRRHKSIGLSTSAKLNCASVSQFVPLSDLSYLTYRTQFYSANLAMVFSGIIACTTDMFPTSHIPSIPRATQMTQPDNSSSRPMMYRPNPRSNAPLRPRTRLRQVRNRHAFPGQHAYKGRPM
jgi:hypothetical protein